MKCKHCEAKILEYRGSWFGPGDDVRCWVSKDRHEPVEPSWTAPARAAGWAPREARAEARTERQPLNLERALRVARLVLCFGQVKRATMHEDGEFESDTTHTVMLALLALEFAESVGCDPGLAAQFAVVHDLVEVYADDTNTARGLTAEEAAAKSAREAEAMDLLRFDHGASRWFGLLHRYEAQQEPEARMVRYLDKVLPKLTHHANRGLALRAMGLSVDEVRRKHADQGAQLEAQYPELGAVGDLFNRACAVVEAGLAHQEARAGGPTGEPDVHDSRG